jgi:hypothetical protein
VNQTGASSGETVRIPVTGTTGGETVNLADVTSGETIRFPTGEAGGARNGGEAGHSGNGGEAGNSAETGNGGEGGEATEYSPTMRFNTSGVSGSGTQTMVFPTGDAMAAAATTPPAKADHGP